MMTGCITDNCLTVPILLFPHREADKGGGAIMFTRIKIVLWLLIFAAVVVQLGGCVYARDERRLKHDHSRQHDRTPDHAELDIRLHS
jgi:hypothetical protein